MRKFKCFLLFTCTIVLGKIQAQNLVPNNSFEDTVSCPSVLAQLTRTAHWDIPNEGTSDFYHGCAVGSDVGTPSNISGYQSPHSGTAYAGIIPYRRPSRTLPEYREYLQVKLKQRLRAGVTYCVSFHVSMAESSAFAIQEMGALFRLDPYDETGAAALPSSAHIENTGVFLEDSTSWTVISGTHLADGNETYLIIGNFKDDQSTTAKDLDPQMFEAYYYIDDVWVTTFNNQCEPPVCELELGNDTILCPGETLVLSAGAATPTYQWQDGSNGSTFTVTEPGTYWLRLPNCELADTIEVQYRDYDFELGNDTTLCGGDTLLLRYENPDFTFLRWQDNSTELDYFARSTGLYWAEVSRDNCILRDSLRATFISTRSGLPERMDFCPEEQPNGILLKMSDTTRTYRWSNGAAGKSVRISTAGKHSVHIMAKDIENCERVDTFEISTYCEPRFYVPNSFTPNSDFINDRFHIVANTELFSNFEIQIFDRWGELVYVSNNPDFEWDGAVEGELLPTTSFTWKMVYDIRDRGGQLERKERVGKLILLK